jgi:hypothetical protein
MLLNELAILRDIELVDTGKRVRFGVTVSKPLQGKVAIFESEKPREVE